MSEPLRIRYCNHRGEIAWREVWPEFMWWGCTRWHPDPQWLLRARDEEKGADRDFAVGDILEFQRPRDANG